MNIRLRQGASDHETPKPFIRYEYLRTTITPESWAGFAGMRTTLRLLGHLRADCFRVQLYTQRMDHLQDGCKARIALARQRLVKAFAS